jgi:hypothetical protein
MKRALTLTLASILALPLFAEEARKSEPKPAATARAGDSPLVAAARRNPRWKKASTIVITNDSLKRSQGHVSTSNAAAALPPPHIAEPKPGPEAEIAARNARRAEEAKKLEQSRAKAKAQSEAERLKRRSEAAAAVEEGLYDGTDVDPAQAEHDAEQANAGNKPPLR